LTAVVADEETVKVAVFVPPAVSATLTLLPVKLELLSVIVGPLTRLGKIVVERVTTPANELTLVRVRIEVFVEPRGTNSLFGLGTILKSGIVTVTLTDVS